MSSILIRVPNWLGDAVMAKYALDVLREIYDNPTFTLVGKKNILELFKLDGYNYNLIEDDTRNEKNRITATIKLGKTIGRHDIAITFQNSFLSALLLYFSGTPIRVGYKKECRSMLLTHALKAQENHQAYEYLRLASFEQKEVKILKETSYAIKRAPEQNIIAVAPGAAYGSSKRWLPERFAELIDKMPEIEFLLLGSKEDIPIGYKIEKHLSNRSSQCRNLIGTTTLAELAELLSKCALTISNDSGIMHLSASLKVPTVAIFGPTDKEKTSIWDATPNIIVQNPPKCSPCKFRECPKERHICMENITVDDLFFAIKNLRSFL